MAKKANQAQEGQLPPLGVKDLPAPPPFTFKNVVANIAAFIFAFTGIHVIVVNRKILPKEVRAPLWREAVVVCCSIFYAVSFTLCMGKACRLF